MERVEGYDKQAELFRALSHPVRLRILDVLAHQEACVCHLTAILGRRQPYVSQQLATLRKAGLIADRREGTLVYYRLADEHLVTVLAEGRAVVRDLTGGTAVFMSVSEEALADCPCPRCQGQARS